MELVHLSYLYAACQVTTAFCFSRRLKFALVIGTIGAGLGLTFALLVPEARGLALSCSAYAIMNITGWKKWDGVPWFRHPKPKSE